MKIAVSIASIPLGLFNFFSLLNLFTVLIINLFINQKTQEADSARTVWGMVIGLGINPILTVGLTALLVFFISNRKQNSAILLAFVINLAAAIAFYLLYRSV
ncbi:hypothetical protein [Peribacillus deserti]|uniref:Uncharacterized protein n=1 Tax=Peribacillus deserti TaxID=673318 RepID=A0A2N5MBJ5_9BACI|nr:hypothetical protein [Peribacillus deserti]PLT31721.1 hypothetical protein CUU66_00725 [Peribacillus deserti]